MSAQQFSRPEVPSGVGQALMSGGSATVIPGSHSSTAGAEEGSSDADHGPRDHPSSASGPLPFRDDKQEAVVVRPYPQVQVHGQPLTLPQHLSIQPGTPVTVSAPPAHLPPGLPLAFTEGMKGALKTVMPSRLIAPAPASDQGHLAVQPKVPGHVGVTTDSSMPPTSAIPVATISSQQGHSSNLHHLMAANVQIIRSSAPALQITSSAAPPHTFTSHLPRGAAAAAVMSSTKGPTVLRPVTGPGTGGQPAVQHIIHQPIQSRPAVATSTAVAPITATRPQSPVITTALPHSAEVAHGRPGLTIHPQSGAISIQRPPPPRDTATRITLPSHPAIAVQKTQPPHTMAQKPIFSTVTPVAAATVAPIQATNTVPSTTTAGSLPHTQMTASSIVTMTMPPHSSHATGVNTSTIPVAKVVPQPISHTSPRIHADYPGERANLIPISAHRSSPNPVAMEARSDNRQSVPMQFQYILPTYPSSPYPLTHTYTPITSSVSGIRQYPVTPQAPSSAMPAQGGVSSAVHLNPMQLMTVDRIGLQSTQISTQAMQPAAMAAQGVPPAPIAAPGLHSSAPIVTQQAPIGSQQQPQPEPKASVVLADGATLVTNPLSGAFGGTQPIGTATQSHPQSGGTTALTPVSSPRPSILRKKPANEGAAVRKSLVPPQSSEVTGCRIDSAPRSTSGSPRPTGVKLAADVHVTVTPPVIGPVEAPPSQHSEVQAMPSPVQHLAQASPALLPTAAPPSQSAPTLSTVPAPPGPSSMANVVAQPTPPAPIGTAGSTFSSVQPEPKVKQEVEPMDTSQPGPPGPPCATLPLGPLGGAPSATAGDAVLGASPRKKPRKQQHVISTEESEVVEAQSTDEERSCAQPPALDRGKHKTPPKEYVDEEGIRYLPVRSRPPITLLRQYRNPWKAAYHHFQQYADIKVKEGKKGTLQDVASQKGVACRAQGYKIRLCAAQLRQLMSLERDVYSRLTTLQEGLIPKKRAGPDDDLHRINELIQGNMQRCKLVMDQVTEAREAMMKVLDHKDRVMRLLDENGTKKSSQLKHKERA